MYSLLHTFVGTIPRKVFFFLICVRLFVIGFFALLWDTPLGKSVWQDDYHHYMTGIGVLIVGIVFYARRYPYYSVIIPLGIAMTLDEYVIILRDIFHVSLPYTYLSVPDTISILLIGWTGLIWPFINEKELPKKS